MSNFYSVDVLEDTSTHVSIRADFGDPTSSALPLAHVKTLMDSALGPLRGGPLVKIATNASLAVGMALVHEARHKYGAVACHDPMLDAYVVVFANGGSAHSLGDTI